MAAAPAGPDAAGDSIARSSAEERAVPRTLAHTSITAGSAATAAADDAHADGLLGLVDLSGAAGALASGSDTPIALDSDTGSMAANESTLLVPVGWRLQRGEASMPELYGSVAAVPLTAPWWKHLLSFIGPSWLISVGYMDPGNWVVDIGGGSAFGYVLLFVVALSCMLAMFLQALAVRLGIATGRDLAQACRDAYPKPVVIALWLSAEAAIVATDLAEVIGSAVALKLLFGLPTVAGVCITVLDVLIVLALQRGPARAVETIVAILVLIIGACFVVELSYARPSAVGVLTGFLPSSVLFTNPDVLLIATGIVGATVMPHNLYLHSSLVQTRAAVAAALNYDKKRLALRYAVIDTVIALSGALFVNAAILITAGAAFYTTGNTDIATLEDAHALLEPLLGTRAAPILFGLALLAAGQISTLTGTMAGQIVMEGFLHWRLSPHYRRLLTRLLAILPALITAAVVGDHGLNELLIVSQVVLSFQLPFAVIPLVAITSSSVKMGDMSLNTCMRVTGWLIAAAITVLNLWLIVKTFLPA